MVNINHAAAFRALPPFLFIGAKSFQPEGFDILQIFQRAHVVLRPVAFIHIFQPLAGVLDAFKTESGQRGFKAFAVFNDAAYAGWLFIFIITAAARAFVLFPQVGHANPAVHAAGRDQFS
jgi:hypothetical protein